MHTRAAGGERYRSRGLRAHFQRDAVVVEREAVGEVFDGFHIGHIHSYLIALIHFKLRQRSGCNAKVKDRVSTSAL